MIRFFLYSVVLLNVFFAVLATDTETCDDSNDSNYESEESSFEEDDTEELAYASSCTVYEPPIPASCNGDPNAYVSSCANNCPNQCKYLNRTNVPCPEYCQVNGCQCKKGYVLDDNTGKCVLPEQCTLSGCNGDPNAYVSSCANNCPNQCKYLNRTNVPCPRICQVNGCQCKKGYVLDDNTGKCVLPEQCTPTCGVNEVYSNCSNGLCQLQDCSQYGAPIPFCPRFDRTKCIGGCVCKSQTLRNPQGVCVPQDECPSYLCLKINHEVYSNCTNGGSQIRNCSQLGKPKPCTKTDPADCIRGCICEEGYLRADDGTCIPQKDCESCKGDPNAYVSNCANNCPNQCSLLNKTQYVCPAYCENGGCQCKKGYVLDDNSGKCVLPEQCPPACGVNEVYSNCSNGLCQLQDCSQYGAPIPFCPRFDRTKCIGGCVCKSKTLRNPQGVCVPQDECPSYLCLKINHEFYSNCTNGGNQIRNCSQLGKPKPCTKTDPADCIRGCICEKGYLRADDGTCIPQKDCESCKGDPNAYVSNCANNCPNQCSLLNKTQYVCPAYCENGGCQCKKGYVLNDYSGKCVLPEQCPKTCNGDPNAEPRCGINCGRHCSNYKNKHPICPRIACRPNQCDCKKDYVYDDNLRKCVLPKDCTPTCGLDEVFSTCYNAACVARTCAQKDKFKTIRCAPMNPKACKYGCVCKQNYLRAENGTCISEDECQTNSNGGVTNCTDALLRLYDGITKFAVNFLSVVVNDNIGKSVVMSPLSVLLAIANLEFGTKSGGHSSNQLLSALNLESTDEIRCTFPELLKSFKSQNESELDISENVYVSIKETLKEQFRNDTAVVLGGETENIDFSNANQAADTINKRIEEQTRNRIKNLVSPSMFTSLTRLVITNAIYFFGAWVKQFDPKQTRKGDFFISDTQSVQKDFMNIKGFYKYGNITSLNAKVLQLPYKGGSVSFVALLPNDIDGCLNLVEKIRDPATFISAIKQLTSSTVVVSIPRFEITSTLDLTPVMKKLNITDIFDGSKSDLDGIIENNEKLAVSAVVHQGYCKVNEEGTEAAAATAIIVGATAVLQTNTFNANHPFVFCIYDNIINAPLFIGLVNADSK